MESLDGNGAVCNELMTVVRRRQQVGLWWGETRWGVWIFDSTDRQRTEVFCCCTSSMISYTAIILGQWLSFSLFFAFPPPPHFATHSCSCLMMHERSWICVFSPWGLTLRGEFVIFHRRNRWSRLKDWIWRLTFAVILDVRKQAKPKWVI